MGRRGEAEWGLMKWTPGEPVLDAFDGNIFTLIHPAAAPANVNIPLLVMVGADINTSSSNYSASLGEQTFLIKSGIGSVQIPSEDREGNALIIVDPNSQRSIDLNIKAMETAPVQLQGVLSQDMEIPMNSFVSIRADLTLGEGLTLSIGEGSFVTVGPGVNLYIKGNLLIQGTQLNPVVITCSNPDGLWGGIIARASGHRVDATYTIFSQSGYHTGPGYDYGHAKRQALFYSENGTLSISHCFMFDHGGQVFYPVSSSVDIEHSLVQRAMTGGQINESDLRINNCIFTDFPDDSQAYQDEDNDCLYLNSSDAVISGSVFMYAKDDGLDSGASGGGTVKVTDSRFEFIFHEGAALSSGGSLTKSHSFTRCNFTNCGQGLELGYSSPNHHVSVDSCLFTNNGIGIRYGDNYKDQHQGTISVSNSESILNVDRDIWNMLRENWTADTLKMQFNNVFVSRENPMYPELMIKD